MKTEMIISFTEGYLDAIYVNEPTHIPKVGDYIKRRHYNHKVIKVSHGFDDDEHIIHVTADSVQETSY